MDFSNLCNVGQLKLQLMHLFFLSLSNFVTFSLSYYLTFFLKMDDRDKFHFLPLIKRKKHVERK